MKIFVSSTIQDLREYREAARTAILVAGHIPVMIEDIAASAKTISEIVNDTLLSCDAVVTIIGERLGTIAPGTNVPWTILEAQLADKFGKPVFVFLKQQIAKLEGGFEKAGEHASTVYANLAKSKLVNIIATPDELNFAVFNALLNFKSGESQKIDALSIIIPPVNSSHFRRLIEHPEELQRISSRDFEKLVADLLAADGWDVNIVPRENAPGPDIIAVSSKIIENVPMKLVVECKRYSDGHPVDINVVRKVMYWVNEEYRATMGMIATSSRFTSEAIQQVNNYHQWRMQLKDQSDIINWLSRQAKIA